jgi:hypothetical protein
MPRQLAHPEVIVTSVNDFIEKMKKPENFESFYMQVVFAQNERKRLREKDAKRRQRLAADREAAAAETTDPSDST